MAQDMHPYDLWPKKITYHFSGTLMYSLDNENISWTNSRSLSEVVGCIICQVRNSTTAHGDGDVTSP